MANLTSSPRAIALKLTDNPAEYHPRPDQFASRKLSSSSGGSTSLRSGPSASQLHRFGPSGPWPWASFNKNAGRSDNADDIPARETERGVRPSVPDVSSTEEDPETEWRNYPASHFPNWTRSVLERSNLIAEVFELEHTSTNVQTIDGYRDGQLRAGTTYYGGQEEELWAVMRQPLPSEVHLKCYFVEDLNGPILQMLGSWFDIEPFFFSSVVNGISTRYEEEIGPQREEHMTITLPFLRAIDSVTFNKSSDAKADDELEEIIDLQTPLQLVVPDGPDQTLVVDLLAVHLTRDDTESIIVSILGESKYWLTTSAEEMKERVLLAAKGVYWHHLLNQTQDPTFMLLIFVWHALYATDEAFDVLFEHILYLERRVMVKFNASDIWLTRELHIIRSMLGHYSTLLSDFHKTVRFIFNHPNRTLAKKTGEEQQQHKSLLKRECDNILNEIERLIESKDMQEQRVKNVMDLVFSTLNVTETETTIQQGWVMQQLSYVTMAFLPATFVSSLFGMNLDDFAPGNGNQLRWFHFVGSTLPLSIGTVWLMIAIQRKMNHPHTSFFFHLVWPFIWLLECLDTWRRRGFFSRRMTRVVDPKIDVEIEVDEESVQEDGKETSRARVQRHWGWRPKKEDDASSITSTARSRGVSRRSTFISERHGTRYQTPASAPAPALEKVIDELQQQQGTPWNRSRLRRIFKANRDMQGRRNTLSVLG